MNIWTLRLILQDPVLFLNVGDHVLLLPVDPAGKSHEKELPRVENVHEPDSTTLGEQSITSTTTNAYARLYIWTLRAHLYGHAGATLLKKKRIC